MDSAAGLPTGLSGDRMRVFIRDPEYVWLAAEFVKETRPGVYDVEISDPDYVKSTPSKRRLQIDTSATPLSSLPLQNASSSAVSTGVDDMCALNYLHEASIMENLRIRFRTQLPYTYTGDICIAVNPYTWLNIYTDELKERYKERLRHELIPHVYATSAAAYRGLRDFSYNQSILVSGESGAGKTETVKILMNHIALISGKKDATIIDKVLKANPLLESFGNAKTARNDNSSRFGKFTMLQFDEQSVLSGSRCLTYLLEKSRVIFQSSELERNFHIFHQLLSAPSETKNKLRLGSKSCVDFTYMRSGDTKTTSIEGVSDGSKFMHTISILRLLGLDSNLEEELLCILAGILYLGELRIQGDSESSSLDGSGATLGTLCDLLGVAPGDLKENMTKRQLDASGESLHVPLSLERALEGRDALAKEAYNRLFNWLVDLTNSSTCAALAGGAAAGSRVVALLDIFGFESFTVNRFEQLCINYANEKLQQKFTHDVFLAVQQEYQSEGLDWESISFQDNSDVVDLLENKLGILALLNEECLLPKGCDDNFLRKITSGSSKHPCFSTHIRIKNEFSIHHYARNVSYNVGGIIDRNRDALPPEMRSLMLTSSNKLLMKIFLPDAEGGPDETAPTRVPAPRRGSSFMKSDTVVTKFKSQLTKLMDTISKTSVQYVRCIKPNGVKGSGTFDRLMIVEQLRCAGMIEAIRISRAAYPYRLPHADFLERFGAVLKAAGEVEPVGDAARCRALLVGLVERMKGLPLKGVAGSEGREHKSVVVKKNKKPFELGLTKVYFSAGILEALEDLRGRFIANSIVLIQRVFRGSHQRRIYLHTRRAAVSVQSFARAVVYRARYRRYLSSVVSVQLLKRARDARRTLCGLRFEKRLLRVQAFWRMASLRKDFRRSRHAARVLTSFFQTKIARKRYLRRLLERDQKAMLTIQLDDLKRRLAEEAAAREMLEKERRWLQRSVEDACRDLARPESTLVEHFFAEKIVGLQAVGSDDGSLLAAAEAEIAQLRLELSQAQRDDTAVQSQKIVDAQADSSDDGSLLAAAEAEIAQLRLELSQAQAQRDDTAVQMREAHDALKVAAAQNALLAQENELLKVASRMETPPPSLLYDDLQTLTRLQTEFSKLQEQSDFLQRENALLKEATKREALSADFLAYNKATLEELTRGRDAITKERDHKATKVKQLLQEKRVAVDGMVEVSAQLEAVTEELDLLREEFAAECRSRIAQHKHTIDYLNTYDGPARCAIRDLNVIITVTYPFKSVPEERRHLPSYPGGGVVSLREVGDVLLGDSDKPSAVPIPTRPSSRLADGRRKSKYKYTRRLRAKDDEERSVLSSAVGVTPSGLPSSGVLGLGFIPGFFTNMTDVVVSATVSATDAIAAVTSPEKAPQAELERLPQHPDIIVSSDEGYGPREEESQNHSIDNINLSGLMSWWTSPPAASADDRAHTEAIVIESEEMVRLVAESATKEWNPFSPMWVASEEQNTSSIPATPVGGVDSMGDREAYTPQGEDSFSSVFKDVYTPRVAVTVGGSIGMFSEYVDFEEENAEMVIDRIIDEIYVDEKASATIGTPRIAPGNVKSRVQTPGDAAWLGLF